MHGGPPIIIFILKVTVIYVPAVVASADRAISKPSSTGAYETYKRARSKVKRAAREDVKQVPGCAGCTYEKFKVLVYCKDCSMTDEQKSLLKQSVDKSMQEIENAYKKHRRGFVPIS